MDRITLNAHEKALADLEVVKMNQLVITDEAEEDPLTLQPNDSVDKETIDLAIPCLITATNETIREELLLKPVSSGYRVQKATTSIRDKIEKVEAFSRYIMSQLKRNYRTFFHTMMVKFKVVRCWLKLKVSDKAPKHWSQARLAILSRIEEKTRSSSREEATIEEISCEFTTEPREDQ